VLGYEVELTAAAIADLEQLHLYVERQSGGHRADVLLAELTPRALLWPTSRSGELCIRLSAPMCA